MRNRKIVFCFYIAGLFVTPHGLSDVFDALDGALHVRLFDDGRLEGEGSGHGFSRDVRDVEVGGERASAFPLLRRALHGGEEHEVRNGIDEDLHHGETTFSLESDPKKQTKNKKTNKKIPRLGNGAISSPVQKQTSVCTAQENPSDFFF